MSGGGEALVPAVGPRFLTRPLRLELRLGRGASRPPCAFARLGAGSCSTLPPAPQTSLSLSLFSSLLNAFVLLLRFPRGVRNEAGPLQSRSRQRTQSSEHVSEERPGKRAPRVAPCRKPTLFVRLGLLSLALHITKPLRVLRGALGSPEPIRGARGEPQPSRGTGVPACFQSKESESL